MTDDQAALLRDKYVLWERASREGPMDLRDYNRRAAEALKAALMIVSEHLQAAPAEARSVEVPKPAQVKVRTAGWWNDEDGEGRYFRFVCALDGDAPEWPLSLIWTRSFSLAPLPTESRGRPMTDAVVLHCSRGQVEARVGDEFTAPNRLTRGGDRWRIEGFTGDRTYSPSGFGGAPVVRCRPLDGMPEGWAEYDNGDGTVDWCGDSVGAAILFSRDSVGSAEPRE